MTSSGQKADDVWIFENILQPSYMVKYIWYIYKQSNVFKSYVFALISLNIGLTAQFRAIYHSKEKSACFSRKSWFLSIQEVAVLFSFLSWLKRELIVLYVNNDFLPDGLVKNPSLGYGLEFLLWV